MTAPQPGDAATLLDLVRQYGTECLAMGAAAQRGSAPDQFHAKQAARALLDRIAALAPALPVQARDEDGHPLWIHGCGNVDCSREGGPEACCDRGPWRPLLVGGDPAPQPAPTLPAQACNSDGVPLWIHLCGRVEAFRHVEAFERVPFHGGCDHCSSGYPKPSDWRPLLVADTAPDLRRLIDPLHAHSSPGAPCTDACYADTAPGGDRAPEVRRGRLVRDDSGAVVDIEDAQPDLIAQVMAELGVDRPEDVLKAARGMIADWADLAEARRERDEARAELADERAAEKRASAELTDIVRRLDEAEVDSGGASERVGYAIQSMHRGWATAFKALIPAPQQDGPIVLRVTIELEES